MPLIVISTSLFIVVFIYLLTSNYMSNVIHTNYSINILQIADMTYSTLAFQKLKQRKLIKEKRNPDLFCFQTLSLRLPLCLKRRMPPSLPKPIRSQTGQHSSIQKVFIL